MATREQIIEGMKKANAAGDIAAVNEMAAYLDSIEAEQAEQPKEQITEQEFTERYGDIPDIDGIIAPQEPKEEPTIAEKALGAGEAALTTATGATGGTLGMIGGTLKGLVDEIRSGEFGSNEAANRIEQKANELMASLTYQPKTETGQEYVEAIGEAGAQLAPLAGLGGQVAQLGQMGKAAAPQARAAIGQATKAAQPAKEVSKAVFTYQSPTKQRIAQLLESNTPDVETAQFKVVKPSSVSPKPKSKLMRALDAGGAKIAKDKTAISAIDQGFDEGVIASVKGAAPSDKADMLRMLDTFEKGKKNQLFAAENRPTDVVGKRVVKVFEEVKKANKKAGSDIDKAARSLKGKQVDSAPIGDRFVTELADMGIGVSDDMKLIFKGSDVEDLPNVERTLSTVFRRMTGDKAPDAYELHRMKRFIDEQVSYGKAGEGLTGKSESVLKSLRRDIDSVLDENFSEYDKANTMYADTIQAIDDMQRAVGRSIDFTSNNADKSLGTSMRTILSNNKSRGRVTDAVMQLDEVARKYPAQLAIEGPRKAGRKASLTQLILFADELDSRFKPVARGSFQGQIEQVANRGRQIATSGSATMAATDAAVGAIGRGLDKIKGVSDEKAFTAMRELLKQGAE